MLQIHRSRSVREVFEIGWRLYRQRFGFLMGAAACVLLPYSFISTYVRTHFTLISSSDMQQLMNDVTNQKGLSSSAVLALLPKGIEIWYGVLILLYILVVFPLLLGIIVRMTDEKMVHEKDLTLSEAGTRAFHRLFYNIGTLVLAALIYVVLGMAFTLLVAFVTSALGSVFPPLAVIVATIGSLIFTVGVIWYLVRFAFVPTIVVEEQASFFKAMRQSFRITRNQAGRLFGFFVMLFIVCFVVNLLMTLMGDLIFSSAGGQLMVSAIVGMLLTPFAFVCISVMYVDLRLRKGE